MFETIEDLNKKQNRAVFLTESRSVAGKAWENEINDIVYWIRKYVSQKSNRILPFLKRPKEIEFEVPKELSEKINFMPNLKIYGVCRKRKEDDSTGGGEYTFNYYNKERQPFSDVSIFIECSYDESGKVYLSTITNSLYHEINHLYHAYMEQTNRGNINNIIKSQSRWIENRFKCFNDKMTIYDILYRLFSDSERNALIASFYGDLITGNIKREEFGQRLNEIKPYNMLIKPLMDNYVEIIDNLSDEDCKWIYNEFTKRGITLNIVKDTVKSFKNALKHKTELYLDYVFRRCCKAASMWFDKQEENETDGPIYISGK